MLIKNLYSTILTEALDKSKLLMHGGPEKITKLDSSKIQGGVRGIYGYGVYFTDSIYKAKDYGPVITYLDPSELSILDTDKSLTEEFVKSILDLSKDNDTGQLDKYAFYGSFAHNLKNEIGKELDVARKNMLSKYSHSQEKLWATMLIDLGYDITKNGYEYVVFNFDKANKYLVDPDSE